jgi:cellulose synthase/poly-beta-1,6-N-acetylglucosamine synthase-like glycosyltransferase
MLFSVVVPTYNRLLFLKEALASVFAQTYSDYEMIIVDDGSTDGTASYVRDLSPLIKIICQANEGASAARNQGMRVARGRYIAFLDSDDVWFPWTLALYAKVLHESGHPAFLAGRPHRFHGETPADVVDNCKVRWTQFRDYLASGDQWRWHGVSSFVLARHSLIQVGGFRSSFHVGEDADLAMRLGIEPGFVQINCPPSFGYRVHEGNISSGPEPLLQAASMLVQAECAGCYPGGAKRRWERWRVLTRQARSAAVASVRTGLIAPGFTLYARTFAWQFAVGSWRFLLGFPLLSIFYAIVRPASPKT